MSDKFFYVNPLGKVKGERSVSESKIESSARLEYAKEILPLLKDILVELGVNEYLGYIRIDGSTVSGAATKESDIDFVAVAKGNASPAEKTALFFAIGKVPQLLEQKTGSYPKFNYHIHLENLEETSQKSDIQ